MRWISLLIVTASLGVAGFVACGSGSSEDAPDDGSGFERSGSGAGHGSHAGDGPGDGSGEW